VESSLALAISGQAWWSLQRRVILCPAPDKRATLIRKFGRSMTARLRADKPGGDGSDLKPDASPAVADIARVEEDKTGAVERYLNCGERAGTRVGPTPLQVLYSDFGETRRLGELGLRPIEQPASGAYLPPRNHLRTIGEDARRNNHIDPAYFRLDTFLYSVASKIYRLPKAKDAGLMSPRC
jgi:hypothetical protein